MHDDPRAVVEDVGDVAQRREVVLDRSGTGRRPPPGTRCTRRRWRRSTGSRGSRRRTTSRAPPSPARPGTACPGWSSGSAGWTRSASRSARFCLPHWTAFCSSRSPGSDTTVLSRQRVARGDLALQLAGGVREGAGQLGLRVRQALVRAGHRDPQRRRAVGGQRHAVVELAAGALAERAVVARARRRGAVGGGARGAGLRAAEVAAGGGGRPRGRGPVGGDERRVVVDGYAAADRAVVGEDERAVLEGAVIGHVGALVGRGGAPRVGAHELGVRVDVHGDRPRRARVGQLEAEQHRPVGVGREVGALQLQPVGVGQVVARVAPAAGEARRLADPRAVDPEPDAVHELERRRPHAAHLARGVPAVGIEAAVLEALGIGPLAGRHLAAILQPVRDRQLSGPGLRAGAAKEHSGNRGRRGLIPAHLFLPPCELSLAWSTHGPERRIPHSCRARAAGPPRRVSCGGC